MNHIEMWVRLITNIGWVFFLCSCGTRTGWVGLEKGKKEDLFFFGFFFFSFTEFSSVFVCFFFVLPSFPRTNYGCKTAS